MLGNREFRRPAGVLRVIRCQLRAVLCGVGSAEMARRGARVIRIGAIFAIYRGFRESNVFRGGILILFQVVWFGFWKSFDFDF